MSDEVWSKIKRERFAAAALAVSTTEKQQEYADPTDAQDDDEDLSDDDSVSPRDLVASGGEAKLQKKFLNRLAEIVARQKTLPKRRPRGSSKDADHVSAAILGFDNELPCVYVAKNAGLDNDDKAFLSDLETWLRAVSLIGQRRSADPDTFWLRVIDYNRLRLEFYVARFADCKGVGNLSPARPLQESCEGYMKSFPRSDISLKDIVANAFELRYGPVAGLSRGAVRLVGFLSRLRAAWETLQEFALFYPDCKGLKIQHIQPSKPIQITTDIIKSELENLKSGLSSRVPFRTGRKPGSTLSCIRTLKSNCYYTLAASRMQGAL